MPITDITIDDYQTQFTDATQYQLVDVREEDEYAEGHLPGAINIPLSDFQSRIDEISEDSPVVLVCAKGGRSSMAADQVAGQGYENVYNLLGGTMEWMNKGLPIES